MHRCFVISRQCSCAVSLQVDHVYSPVTNTKSTEKNQHRAQDQSFNNNLQDHLLFPPSNLNFRKLTMISLILMIPLIPGSAYSPDAIICPNYSYINLTFHNFIPKYGNRAINHKKSNSLPLHCSDSLHLCYCPKPSQKLFTFLT